MSLLFFLLTIFFCIVFSLSSLQGANQHVNTGADIHTAAAERRGT